MIHILFMITILVLIPGLALGGMKKWSYRTGALLILLWIFLQKTMWATVLFKGALLTTTWITLMFLATVLRKTYLKNLESIDHEIDQKNSKIQSLHLSDSILAEELKVLEQSLAQKESLYESLKELNKTLEFPKTVEVFSNLISRLTSFEDGWLIISSSLQDQAENHFCYQISRDESPILRKGSVHQVLSEYQKEAHLLCTRSPSIIFINNPIEDPRFSQKGVTTDTPTLTGIGLFHEGISIGALILEGCKKRELESLEILSIQLSMEIEKARLYEKVKNLSIIDGLTQTYLKRHFLSLLEDEFHRLQTQSKTCTLLMMDIDHFKSFNDNFGHLVGDILLKELSECLRENLRPMDLIGRFGGEEFVIALPETSREEAFQIAERIRNDVQSRKFFIHEKLFKLTLSIGISYFPEDSGEMVSLIEMADEALYIAKGAGRNQVKLYKKSESL